MRWNNPHAASELLCPTVALETLAVSSVQQRVSFFRHMVFLVQVWLSRRDCTVLHSEWRSITGNNLVYTSILLELGSSSSERSPGRRGVFWIFWQNYSHSWGVTGSNAGLSNSPILMAYVITSYEADPKEKKKRKHTHRAENKLMLKQFK